MKSRKKCSKSLICPYKTVVIRTSKSREAISAGNLEFLRL